MREQPAGGGHNIEQPLDGQPPAQTVKENDSGADNAGHNALIGKQKGITGAITYSTSNVSPKYA